MKSCVFYFSRTGNTKRLAETISETLEIPVFDISASQPSTVGDFDLLIVGTPVTGLRPAVEVTAFLDKIPEGTGKKAIVFCTYAFTKGGAMKHMSQQLSKKGYITILSVGKRGVKPSKNDFREVIEEIGKAVEKHQPPSSGN
ncbi:MAG: hypothetical protein NWF05_11525 [Candidatus Bathyarchaeota archaeon]|nr:hypothetical protein [Candidatus Bathyarchaeota archaeon]